MSNIFPSTQEALEWIDQYASIKFAYGNEHAIEVCPECDADKYKLYVNLKKEKFHCFHCGWGSGASFFALLAGLSGMSEQEVSSELLCEDSPFHIDNLADYVALKLGRAQDARQTDRNTKIVCDEIPFPAKALSTSAKSREVIKYLVGRGVTLAHVNEYLINWSARIPYVNKKGHTKYIDGPFVMFPVVALDKVVAWQGRRINEGLNKYMSRGPIKKHLWPVMPKFFKLLRKTETLVIVEGVFDAIGAHECGYAALCTFGKSLSNDQLILIKRLAPKNIVIAWDKDAAKEVERAMPSLKSVTDSVRVVDHDLSKKVDFGDALASASAREYMRGLVDSAVSTYSSSYFGSYIRGILEANS